MREGIHSLFFASFLFFVGFVDECCCFFFVGCIGVTARTLRDVYIRFFFIAVSRFDDTSFFFTIYIRHAENALI